MKFASAEHFDIDPTKLLAAGAVGGGIAAAGLPLVAGQVLGSATVELQLVLGVLVFYIVASAPKRMLDSVARSQARDAVLLSVIARACLSVSGSRAQTLMMLSSGDPEIARALVTAKRRLLLGWGVRDSLVSVSGSLASYSATNVLRGLAELSPGTISDEGEEGEGLAGSSRLAHETKLPIFLTTCFFAPILLLLYSIFSHVSAPGSLAELFAIEVVLLDVAYYLCSSDRGGAI